MFFDDSRSESFVFRCRVFLVVFLVAILSDKAVSSQSCERLPEKPFDRSDLCYGYWRALVADQTSSRPLIYLRSLSKETSLARPPCNSICRRMVDECSHIDGVVLPNCDQNDNGKCTNYTVSDKDSSSSFSCPEPTVFDHELNYCTLPCPVPLYTRSEISLYNLLVGIIATISCVGAGKIVDVSLSTCLLTRLAFFQVLLR